MHKIALCLALLFGTLSADVTKFTLPFNEEMIEISFPNEPELLEQDGVPCLSATDEEGMTFTLASIQIPEEGFDLYQVVNFLKEAIENSSTKMLLAFSYPDPNPIDTGYCLMWVENDTLSTLMFIRGAHSIYLLETSACNAVYLNIDALEVDTDEFDILTKDSLKTAAFIQSLNILHTFLD